MFDGKGELSGGAVAICSGVGWDEEGVYCAHRDSKLGAGGAECSEDSSSQNISSSETRLRLNSGETLTTRLALCSETLSIRVSKVTVDKVSEINLRI